MFLKIDSIICQYKEGLTRHERFVKIARVCQYWESLSRYEGLLMWFVKVGRICQRVFTEYEGLSIQEGFVKVLRKGLSI